MGRASRAFPAVATPIGEVTAEPGISVRRPDGSLLAGSALPQGFAHFGAPAHSAGRRSFP